MSMKFLYWRNKLLSDYTIQLTHFTSNHWYTVLHTVTHNPNNLHTSKMLNL